MIRFDDLIGIMRFYVYNSRIGTIQGVYGGVVVKPSLQAVARVRKFVKLVAHKHSAVAHNRFIITLVQIKIMFPRVLSSIGYHIQTCVRYKSVTECPPPSP